MQDEEMDDMDKLIREASSSYHSDYDDKAWLKMEELLDIHLPQKEVSRRPLIIFLLMLVIGGAVFFALVHPWNKKGSKQKTVSETKPANTRLHSITANTPPGEVVPFRNGPNNINGEAAKFLPVKSTDKESHTFRKKSNNGRSVNKRPQIKISGSTAVDKYDENEDTAIIDKIFPGADGQVIHADETVPDFSANGANNQPAGVDIQPAERGIGAKAGAIGTEDTAAVSKSLPGNLIPPKAKTKNKFANNFAITLSAGPDISFVGLDHPGKTRLNYGAGLSYTFAQRFTLRSGFYVAKKVYNAQPGDYHPPHGYWTYYTNLLSIAADCNVYEIPLNVSYNFNSSKNHGWLAGIGLSTFVMKKETYKYKYANNWGQTMYREWTIRNKNNHYFSVLTISGGYQYRVNRHFSVMAEPYFKLPLAGIGFGKIKLNSGGVLVTTLIKPFAK